LGLKFIFLRSFLRLFFFKISLHYFAIWRTVFFVPAEQKKGLLFDFFRHQNKAKARQFLSKRADTMNLKATRKTNFSAINHNKQKMKRKIGHFPPFSKGNTKRS